MKRTMISGLIAAGLLLGGMTLATIAGNGPGNGKGYGGPPQSEAARAARQAGCVEKNGGICPNGGPRTNCPAGGMGKGQGAGNCGRNGLRDGTGPRSANGTCPNTPAPNQK